MTIQNRMSLIAKIFATQTAETITGSQSAIIVTIVWPAIHHS